MKTACLAHLGTGSLDRSGSLLLRFNNSRNALGFVFMLPAAIFLLGFLTYPLGLGVWLGFTDTRIGRAGDFIGLQNYAYLMDDERLLAFGF